MSLSNVCSLRWWLGIRPQALAQEPPVMAVTAIVPAYNEAVCIRDTLVSLRVQTYPLAAIIVVDDCSDDGTGDVAQTVDGVTVIRTAQNQGTKSQAQNYALDRVETELFVTVDADTILAPDALYEAMRYFNDPSCEVVCGTVIPQVRKNFWERGRLVEYLYAQTIMKPAQNHHGLVLVASGCFSVFKTETVRRYGGFNERTLAEDMDLTWEIQDEGGRVYYAPKAICYPVDPPTGTIYVRQLDRWYRGFMQNLKVRHYKVFPHKWSMAVMVYLYLMWFAVSAFLLPLYFYAVSGSVVHAISFALLVNAVFVWTPALYSAWRLGVLRDAMGGLVPFLVLPYLNLLIYCRAVVLELICNQKLATWQKGH